MKTAERIPARDVCVGDHLFVGDDFYAVELVENTAADALVVIEGDWGGRNLYSPDGFVLILARVVPPEHSNDEADGWDLDNPERTKGQALGEKVRPLHSNDEVERPGADAHPDDIEINEKAIDRLRESEAEVERLREAIAAHKRETEATDGYAPEASFESIDARLWAAATPPTSEETP